jgi:DNA-binding GntR family transcriptional regulator
VHTGRHPHRGGPPGATAGNGGGPSEPGGRASRSDNAYRALKSRLLLGEFPLNVRLGEERLAAELGVSRTPIREALKRLHSEGLVEAAPEGGYLPFVPDVVIMRHLYEVRAGLELQALQRPGRLDSRHDPAILEPLRDQWRALAAGPLPAPDPGFVLLDESFHVSLAMSAGNLVAADLLRHVNERIRVVRMLDFLSQERIEATIAEHLEIAELVLAGQLPGAEQAFSAHLAGSMAVVEERVQQSIARMVSGRAL